METLNKIYKYKSTLILILTPLLLLPILLLAPVNLQRELSCAYTILLMAVYWVTEVVPLAVTSLLPLVLYPLLGVAPASKVSVTYLKDVNILFLGGLTVAVAVEHWDLHKRVALKVLTLVGAKPRWLVFGFMITTAFLSMWISNVATTAMMIPIAQAVLDELDNEEKTDDKAVGGAGTSVDGRPPPGDQTGKFLASTFQTKESHIAAQIGSINEAQELGNRLAKSSFEAPIANGYALVPQDNNNEAPPSPDIDVPTIVVGPDSAALPPTTTSFSADHRSTTRFEDESVVSSTRKLLNDSTQVFSSFNDAIDKEKRKKGLSKALTICVCYASNIGGTATLTGTGPNLIMAGQFKTAYPDAPEVDFGKWVVFALPGMIIYLLFCWVWLQFLFLNMSVKDICTGCRKSRRTAMEEQTEAVIRRQYHQLGIMKFAEKSVLGLFITLALLWLTRDPGFVSGWGSLPIFKTKYVTDATVAMLIAFLLFVFPSKKPNFLRRGKNEDSGPVPPLLTWKIVQQKMAWNVILLLGGGFAMAYGAKESGLSKLLGNYLRPLQSFHPFIANLICCVVICAMTQCTSNTATATVFLPILAEVAEILLVNPLLLMLPATLITSYAFMLPVSTPPNAIAYSYNHLTTWDMIRAGFLLTVTGIFVALFSVYVVAAPLFNLQESCPDWVHSTLCNSTTHNTSLPGNATLPT